MPIKIKTNNINTNANVQKLNPLHEISKDTSDS